MKKILMAFVFIFPLWANSGSSVGNGGDPFAFEFINTARDVINLFSWINLSDLPEFNALAFTQAVQQTHIASEVHVILNGSEVGAINYPDQTLITVNQSFWQTANPNQRMGLVIHEYLGIMRLNDANYRLSGPIYQKNQQAQQSPDGKPHPFTVTELVGGYLVDQETPNANVEAQNIYKNQCLQWAANVKKDLGQAVGAIECGMPEAASNRWQYGYRSQGQFVFFTAQQPYFVRQQISGNYFNGRSQAAVNAAKSYRDACLTWLKNAVANAGSRMIYASCGGVLGTSLVDGYQYSSSGLIILRGGNFKQR